jgi:hypothetical protein
VLRLGCDRAEYPFGSGAQGNEAEDEDQDLYEAVPAQLGQQVICGPAELAQQPRCRGRKGSEMGLQGCDSSRHHGGVCGRRGIWQRRLECGLMLLVDPSSNHRILQQLEKLLHLW